VERCSSEDVSLWDLEANVEGHALRVNDAGDRVVAIRGPALRAEYDREKLLKEQGAIVVYSRNGELGSFPVSAFADAADIVEASSVLSWGTVSVDAHEAIIVTAGVRAGSRVVGRVSERTGKRLDPDDMPPVPTPPASQCTPEAAAARKAARTRGCSPNCAVARGAPQSALSWAALAAIGLVLRRRSR
jgi:hypothetical protein